MERRTLEFYNRERAVYERLRERKITDVLGFHVPQLIRADDHLHVVEMSIVTPPLKSCQPMVAFVISVISARCCKANRAELF